MDTLGFETRASRKPSGCNTTTPCGKAFGWSSELAPIDSGRRCADKLSFRLMKDSMAGVPQGGSTWTDPR